jgi:hypothetical protein
MTALGADFAAIGKGEGLTTRKTRYLIDHHGLPVFRVGRNLYSRPSKVREWWIEREREHAEALARQ